MGRNSSAIRAITAKVQLEEVVALVNNLRLSKRVGKEHDSGKKTVTIGGSTETSQHSFSEDEKEQFAEHINAALADDKVLAKRIPIEPTTMQLFDEVKDGLILCKLINDGVPGTIDERVLVSWSCVFPEKCFSDTCIVKRTSARSFLFIK